MFRRRKKKDEPVTPVEADEVAEDLGDEDAEPGQDGPYDSSEAPKDGVHRLDLGSLLVPVVEGINVQMQGDQQGNIRQVVLIHGDSALQLMAVAAPRTEDIWDEVREEIQAQIHREGGSVKDGEGPYGPELHARLKGPKGTVQARFVGISGPRWLIRAVFQGKAAVDDEAAAVLDGVLRGVIVERGDDPRPVSEPLPMTLPKEVAEQARAQAAAESNGARKPSPGASAE
ncbi:hypothetical protein Afil01_48920 [Actinorhabdospora filicis]|uniref:DUF3710 domain-containing protein n=1 Tax=Actinorhabdospora filicis TaxID=1785913 RepID=A0A9W6SQE2_9ACTN|nr:DUF3710 domain-containing protein [Actinorhabdospora filicis]GLZ80085.1 hypothetical protein Afil01_48920 [Actinorhabdospora filicis]